MTNYQKAKIEYDGLIANGGIEIMDALDLICDKYNLSNKEYWALMWGFDEA